MTPAAASSSEFPPTRWTLIARVNGPDPAESKRALNEICALYHYPLYCYIRRRGLDHHDAQDALQDFVARLMSGGAFQRAAADKGRLRGYLLTALARFLLNRKRDDGRRQRRVALLSEESLASHESTFLSENFADHETPERIFERKWARSLVDLALTRLRKDYTERGKPELFRALYPGLVAGGTLQGLDVPAAGAALGMSEGAFRTAFSRLLQEYRTVFQSEVRQTVASDEEVDDEILRLASLLAK